MGNTKAIEETLIRQILGWPVVDGPEAADRWPAVFWSSGDRCFMLKRSAADPPERFSPTRCLRDCMEVRSAVDNRLRCRLARPVWDGNVRVVADCGKKEVVVEARSLPWTLSMAMYRAANEGLA